MKSFVKKLYLYFLDQLWRFTKAKKLENKRREWKFVDKKWKIPNAGNPGLIKDLESALVLGSDADDKVFLEDTKDENAFTQKWIRSKPNQDGWFTFQNSGTGNYLTALSNDKVTVSGNIELKN